MITITKNEEVVLEQIKIFNIEYPEGIPVDVLRRDLGFHEYDLVQIIDELKEGVMLGYWNDRVTAAMLVKYGEVGPAEDTKEVKIVMQCKEAWSE